MSSYTSSSPISKVKRNFDSGASHNKDGDNLFSSLTKMDSDKKEIVDSKLQH